MVVVAESCKDELLKYHKSHIGSIEDIALDQSVGQSSIRQQISLHAEPGPKISINTDIQNTLRYPDGTIRTLTEDEIAWFRSQEARTEAAVTLPQVPIDTNEHGTHSVEEPAAREPVPSNKTNYDQLFGSFKTYQTQLDNSMDRRFVDVARQRGNRVEYYPVLPLEL